MCDNTKLDSGGGRRASIREQIQLTLEDKLNRY